MEVGEGVSKSLGCDKSRAGVTFRLVHLISCTLKEMGLPRDEAGVDLLVKESVLVDYLGVIRYQAVIPDGVGVGEVFDSGPIRLVGSPSRRDIYGGVKLIRQRMVSWYQQALVRKKRSVVRNG